MQEIIPDSVSAKSLGEFYLNDDMLQTKYVILLCCFGVGILAYGDYLNFGFSLRFRLEVFVRIAFILFSLLILIILERVKTVQQYDHYTVLWSTAFIFTALFINITRPVTSINFSYIDTLIVLTFYLVFPISICTKSIFAGFLTIADLGIILLFKDRSADLALETIVLSYILANVLGLFMANRIQQFRQKQYTAFVQEQNIRQELEKIAYIDHLTGTLNRRKFFQIGSLEFIRSKNMETPFSLIMLDLDFFKKLNDKAGHAAGDKYLKEFTRLITANKRRSDILGRLGGEEFALILPETNIHSALEIAERLRKACEEKEISFQNQILRTTISIGVSAHWHGDQTIQDVLKRADEALYQAKQKGRNQVQFKIKGA